MILFLLFIHQFSAEMLLPQMSLFLFSSLGHVFWVNHLRTLCSFLILVPIVSLRPLFYPVLLKDLAYFRSKIFTEVATSFGARDHASAFCIAYASKLLLSFLFADLLYLIPFISLHSHLASFLLRVSAPHSTLLILPS